MQRNGAGRTLPIDQLSEQFRPLPPVQLEQTPSALFHLRDRVLFRPLSDRLARVPQSPEFSPIDRVIAAWPTSFLVRSPRPVPHGELGAG